MSRIGLKPIPLPAGVEVKIEEQLSIVKGPKGELRQHIPTDIAIEVADGEIRCTRTSNAPQHRSSHGLVRALLANQVTGVTDGFSKALSIVGVGYRAELKGKDLVLSLGFSHPIDYPAPDGITFEVPDQTKIVVKGMSKQQVGQVAAELRDFRPPEPYKGKGVRYENEQVQRKAGKSATKG
jgi:large subunit ribosomal protein L6